MKRLMFVAAAVAVGVAGCAALAGLGVVGGAAQARESPAGPGNVHAAKTVAKRAEQALVEVREPMSTPKIDEASIDAMVTGSVPAKRPIGVMSTARKELALKDEASRVLPSERTKDDADIDGPQRPYEAIVERYAEQYGIPADLAHAVITVESSGRPHVRGKAGEIGLMQIKPATARGMGYKGSADGLFDPETNIRYGMLYLAKAHELAGGNTCGTILRYNAGHSAKRMNKRSAAYCSKVKLLVGS